MNHKHALPIAAILVVGIVILDLNIPLGYAVSLLYVIPLIVAAPALKYRYIPLLALLVTLLAGAGFFLSPSSGNLPIACANRLMSIATYWLVCFIVMKRKQSLDSYMALCQGMEKRVEERTSELSAINQALTHEVAWRTQAQEALQESEQKFRDLTERSMVGVYLLQDGIFKYLNPKFAEIFGARVEDLEGQSFVGLIYPDDLLFIEECVRKRLLGIEAYGHYIFRGVERSGKVLHLEVFNSQTSYKGAPAIIGVLVDVSDRVSLEEERQKYEKELVAARQHAEEASQAKSQFLANMSHELRTPMNGFLMILQLLLRGDAGHLEAKQRELLLKAENAGHSLLQIISDILDHSKIEAGKLTLMEKPFSLRECVGDAVDVFTVDAQQKGLALQVSMAEGLPDGVLGDMVRFRQVLVNLLGNAVKFTERGAVSIRIEGRRQSGGTVKVTCSVADTGIGIAAEKKSLLFRSFTQIDPSDERRYGGTGLGLAISSRIVEMMGGSISCDSIEGAGSTFSFTVPFKESTPAAHPAEEPRVEVPQEESKGQRRILIAEDDPLASFLLQDMLATEGYETDLAQTGIEAIDLWQRGQYDLIVMDVQMPKMNGITATRAIREKEAGTGRHIPIVAMTAHAFKEDEERCLAAGMDAYLTKPLDLTSGLQVLDRLMSK